MRSRLYWKSGLVLLVALTACAWTAAAEDYPALKAQVEKAKMLAVEKVCAPMQTTRIYRPILVPNPDGKTYDVIIRYLETYWGPHTVYAFDLGTGKIHTYTEPSALPAQHNFMIGPDGRFYQHWSIPGKGTVLMVYDPAMNRWIHAVENLPLSGETRPLCTGTDGMVYGAASRETKVTAYQYDPGTGKVTDYGALGPAHAPNPSWGYSVAADDEYVYVASGKIPWYIVACNKKTGEDKVLHTMDDPRGHVGVSQRRYGCVATSRGHGKTQRFWLYKGKAIPQKNAKEKPPWPEPEKAEPWVKMPPRPKLGTGNLQPRGEGKCELWYQMPGEQEWKSFKYEVPTYPVAIYGVLALPDGRLVGSGGSYLGDYLYDPKTNQASHPGIIHLSQYCATVAGGKVYMSGYPSSALFEWDPGKPWTANVSETARDKPLPENSAKSNPRRLCYLNKWAGTHKMWAAATGGDGKAYFGGRWYRNGEGGGLAWWDPKSKQGGGMAEPFTTFQIASMTTAADGRYVVMSTICARDQTGKLPTPTTAKVFVFDTQTSRLVRDFEPVANATRSGAIAGCGGPFILGITYDPADRPAELKPEEQDPYLKGRTLDYGVKDQRSILYKANVETGEMVWTKKLPYPVGLSTDENFCNHEGYDFRLGPDGMVWTFTGARRICVNPGKRWYYTYVNATVTRDEKLPDGYRLDGMNVTLVRIDPRDGAIHVVGKVSHGGQMAFVGRDLYMSSDKRLAHHNKHLRRIRNAVPK